MISDYHNLNFALACASFFVRKRVGKRFKVISRFPTYEQAFDYLRFLLESYPGIYFDIKHVSFSYLDKKSSL